MLVPAGAHVTALGARTAWDLTSSHLLSPPACVVPQGVPRGRRAPRGYSRIMVRPASASTRPTLHQWRRTVRPQVCQLPSHPPPRHTPAVSSAIPWTRVNSILSRCAPASLQMRANAVFAPFLLACLLILNTVPGARGLALASMVPRVGKTHIAYFHQTTGPSSIHRSTPLDPLPPSTTPLDLPPRPPPSTTPF